MMGQKICFYKEIGLIIPNLFYKEIRLIIPELSLLPLLIWSPGLPFGVSHWNQSHISSDDHESLLLQNWFHLGRICNQTLLHDLDLQSTDIIK